MSQYILYQTEALQDIPFFVFQSGPPGDPLPPGATPCAAPQALACGSIQIKHVSFLLLHLYILYVRKLLVNMMQPKTP